ncbi:MAG: hypothetical protein AB7S70_02580 [Hyphomicrobium sp.]|uniref:hypothetical protein n=1 Tax=Hyphomicrobium sp. TaxID=82 RepID=UPI003D0F3C8F
MVEAARQQVMEALTARLKAKLPGDRALMRDLAGEAAALCKELGQPGAISVREEDGHAIFVLNDPMKLMLMAMALKQQEGARS